MELVTIWMAVGFLMAAYSVIANDSVQTLGTWIASNHERFNWKILWAAASAVLLWALWYGWYTSGGACGMRPLQCSPLSSPGDAP